MYVIGVQLTHLSAVYSLLLETVFRVKVGNTLATAHPEANTSLLSQTMTIFCCSCDPKCPIDLTIFDRACALEGVLCLEHFEGNVAT